MINREEEIIELLQKVIEKQNITLGFLLEFSGRSVNPDDPEERERYREYVKQRLYN